MTKKLSPFQKKLLDIFERSKDLDKVIKDTAPFDFKCINDQCGARNGQRYVGVAWKTKDDYNVYCDGCGNLELLTKNQFKTKRSQFNKEDAYSNMEKIRKNPRENYTGLEYESDENEFLDE